MFLKNSSTVGIELSNGRLTIVEMDTHTKPIRVKKFIAATFNDESRDECASHIRKIIDEEGFSSKKVQITFSSSSILYKTINLPQMSKREMRVVLKREAKKEASSFSGEIVYDNLIIGSVEEKGIEKNKVLLVIAPRDEVDDTIAFWREAGIEPQFLTTSSLALLNCLKMFTSEGKEEAIAFLYLGVRKASIIIADQGNLELSRDFILGTTTSRGKNYSHLKEEGETSLAGVSESEYTDRVLTEINRSFLYYKHQFRGKRVERIVLGGELAYLETIRASLKERVEQNIDIFLPIKYLDTTNLGAQQKAFQEQLPSLAISLGLCLKEIKHNKINLIPQEIVEQKQLLVRKVAMGTSSAILFLSLLIGYLCLSVSVSNQQKMLFKQRVFWSEIAPMVTNLTQVERESQLFQSRQYILDNFIHSWTLWQNMLKSLSLLVPDEMLLHCVEVEKKEEIYHIDIKGEVVADSAASAQAAFNRFYYDLEHSHFFKGLDPPTITLSPYVETFKSNPGSSNINLRLREEEASRLRGHSVSKLDFEISGECSEG